MEELGRRVNMFSRVFKIFFRHPNKPTRIKILGPVKQIVTLKTPGKTLQDFASTDETLILILGHEGDRVGSAESHALVAALPYKGCSHE